MKTRNDGFSPSSTTGSLPSRIGFSTGFMGCEVFSVTLNHQGADPGDEEAGQQRGTFAGRAEVVAAFAVQQRPAPNKTRKKNNEVMNTSENKKNIQKGISRRRRTYW